MQKRAGLSGVGFRFPKGSHDKLGLLWTNKLNSVRLNVNFISLKATVITFLLYTTFLETEDICLQNKSCVLMTHFKRSNRQLCHIEKASNLLEVHSASGYQGLTDRSLGLWLALATTRNWSGNAHFSTVTSGWQAVAKWSLVPCDWGEAQYLCRTRSPFQRWSRVRWHYLQFLSPSRCRNPAGRIQCCISGSQRTARDSGKPGLPARRKD